MSPLWGRLHAHMQTSFRTLAALAFVLWAHAVAAQDEFRLFEIGATRFTRQASGEVRVETGRLTALNQFKVNHTGTTVHDPGAANGKVLIFTEAWFAYAQLGPQALANFRRDEQPTMVAGLVYYGVAPAEDAHLAVGRVPNLSTRGPIQSDASKSIIGGFVITDHPRWVLIRAVGPGLIPHGVNDAAPDPYLSLWESNVALYFNDDWGQRFNADDIETAAASAGAFPIVRSGKDAALLVELEPGQYSAQVVTATGTAPGTALLEIYILP